MKSIVDEKRSFSKKSVKVKSPIVNSLSFRSFFKEVNSAGTFFLMILFVVSANVTNAQVDLIKEGFPKAKQEVLETFEAIAQSVKDKDLDKLISFHAYGPKFAEFKNRELRNGDEANEAPDHTRVCQDKIGLDDGT